MTLRVFYGHSGFPPPQNQLPFGGYVLISMGIWFPPTTVLLTKFIKKKNSWQISVNCSKQMKNHTHKVQLVLLSIG